MGEFGSCRAWMLTICCVRYLCGMRVLYEGSVLDLNMFMLHCFVDEALLGSQ